MQTKTVHLQIFQRNEYYGQFSYKNEKDENSKLDQFLNGYGFMRW